jgi:hypothetical protein
MLMFAALSIGILTALTGTGISQIAPVFAETEDSEDNDDDNCNERNKKIDQEIDCKILVDNRNNLLGTSQNFGGLAQAARTSLQIWMMLMNSHRLDKVKA